MTFSFGFCFVLPGMLGSIMGLWAIQPLGSGPPGSVGVGSCHGMVPKLDQLLVGHPSNFCATFTPACLEDRTNCRS